MTSPNPGRLRFQNFVPLPLLLVVFFSLGTALSADEYKWQRLDGCTLAKGWKDGDSFTVRVAPRKFRVFRLYFVDSPEDSADTRYPARVAEQAAYFGVSLERAFQLGDQAAAYTEKALSSAPFTVWTLWQPAPGASKRPRFYAMIEVDGRCLSSRLIEKLAVGHLQLNIQTHRTRIVQPRLPFPPGNR